MPTAYEFTDWGSTPRSGFVQPLEPLAQAERQRQATRPGTQVRCTFSVCRAWRPAVGAVLARTLGLILMHWWLMSAAAVISRFALLSLLATLTMTTDASAQSPKEQVFAAERAFARSMAERNLEAFKTFLSEEAIFFTGPTPLRGTKQVAAGWARFFAEPAAPFSWEPDEVEVLESGTLALSTGPVRDPSGKIVARFNSIWRLEASNVWRVVFDKGSPLGPEVK